MIFLKVQWKVFPSAKSLFWKPQPQSASGKLLQNIKTFFLKNFSPPSTKKAICWFWKSCFSPIFGPRVFLSFSCHHSLGWLCSHSYFSLIIIQSHSCFSIFYESLLCLKKPPTPLKINVYKGGCIYMRNFFVSLPCSMILGVPFGFSGFVFCFLFYFFRVARNTHWIFYIVIQRQTRSRKGGTFYTIFIFRLFYCRYNNHPPDTKRQGEEEINSEHVKTYVKFSVV